MERQGHPIAGGIVFILAVMPSFNGPLLSLIFSMILFLLTCRYGLWGGFWRTFVLCTIVFIPLLLMARTQLPGEQRRRRYSYY
ncbi:hypothetical protein [Trueperella bernardiae]|uniref:hypothetical protein n=1 Tax=Trueperella bernardiae TaxID=59561 RepID=UPI00294B2FFD|nr:hypothetical protein [Trueperella bernardiae]